MFSRDILLEKSKKSKVVKKNPNIPENIMILTLVFEKTPILASLNVLFNFLKKIGNFFIK